MALEEVERQPWLNCLPHELINEILVKLPVKSLLQFKCISKYYLALISSSQFVKFHLNYNEQRKHILRFYLSDLQEHELRCIRDSDSDIYVPFLERFEIVGCVNGLICVSFSAKYFYLWNPSIRKCKELTVIDFPPIYEYHVGFGYDEIHDDYKVVLIYGKVKVEIFSVKNNSLGIIDGLPDDVIRFGPGQFVNGRLHWVTNCNIIITIDLADEKWGKIEYPCCEEGVFSMNIGELGGDLCMIHGYDKLFLDVWVRKESWAKIYTIKFPPNYCCAQCILWPCYFNLNGGEVLFLVGKTFMIYNPKDSLLTSLQIAQLDTQLFAITCLESLVCP